VGPRRETGAVAEADEDRRVGHRQSLPFPTSSGKCRLGAGPSPRPPMMARKWLRVRSG
jgi:hypothetical protein